VRLVLDGGKSVGAAARDLDLTETALREWVKRAQADRTKGRTGLTTAEREELVRLRKALRIAEEERDILQNESRALPRPDLWARNSVAYARPPGAVAVRFLVTSRAR
jgi:transposase